MSFVFLISEDVFGTEDLRNLLSACHLSVTLMWFSGSGYLSWLKDEEPVWVLLFVVL